MINRSIPRVFIYFIMLYFFSAIVNTFASPAYIEEALQKWFEEADFESPVRIIEKNIRKEQNSDNKKIAYAYLAFFYYEAAGNVPKADESIRKLAELFPGTELRDIAKLRPDFSEEVTEDFQNHFQDIIRQYAGRNESGGDAVKPDGEIKGLQAEYQQGDTVRCTLRGKDDNNLKKMIFEVKKTSVKNSRNVSGKYADENISFSTENWNPGSYTALLKIEDEKGNAAEIKKEFRVKKEDTEKPRAELSGIQNKYPHGATVDLTIRVSDNISLKNIKFEVLNTSVKKSWSAEGKNFEQKYAFLTKEMKADTYTCILRAEDKSGNFHKISGSFEIEKTEEGDTVSPSCEVSGIKDTYLPGDSIPFDIRAGDDRQLKQLVFTIEGTSVRKSWNVNGRESEQKYVFSTENRKPGTYTYILTAEDAAGNRSRDTGEFFLKEKAVEISRPSSETLLREMTQSPDRKEADFIEIRTNKEDLRAGENIVYHFKTEKKCYLTLFILTVNGELIQLFPNKFMPDSAVESGKTYDIPGKEAPIELEVSGPPGREKMIALVSGKPLKLFEASFEDRYFMDIGKDNEKVIAEIIQNLRNTKEQDIFYKQFTYSIRK